jgi:hypothetical protein
LGVGLKYQHFSLSLRVFYQFQKYQSKILKILIALLNYQASLSVLNRLGCGLLSARYIWLILVEVLTG